LEKQAERHLSRDQLERLAVKSGSRVPTPADELETGSVPPESPDLATLDASLLEQAITHLRSCGLCRANLAAYQAANAKLDGLMAGEEGKSGSDCPPETEWLRVAAGLTGKEKALEYLRHAAGCDHCGPLLSRATMAFKDDATDEEERAFAALHSTTETWKKQLAGKLAGRSQAPIRKTNSFLKLVTRPSSWVTGWPAWAYGAAATVMAIAVVFALLHRSGSESPEALLAQAYSEHRTLELRFAGAQYGPIRTERAGSGQSRLTKPSSLLEAEALISRRLRADPDNPILLDAKGRADLLDGNYDAAIQTFQKALGLEPDSVPILTDAGSGYFARAELADQAVDYGKAIELLSRALAKKPDDPIALYNRALVAEKMFLYHQAVEDWRHYLRVDARGEWASEANQHLNALLQKLNDQKSNATKPLLQPAAFKGELGGPGGKLHGMEHFQVEDYLREAVREWLPLAFSENTPSSAVKSGDALLALRALAEISRERHGDFWLVDLLKARGSNDLPSAIQALAESVRENATGQFSLARNDSIRAQRLFHRAGNIAGELRARFETVYAFHLLEQDGKQCLAASFPLEKELQARRYPWLQAQVLLEQSSCWTQSGDFSEAQGSVERALAKAEKSDYGTLYLRALGIAASVQSGEGNEAQACSVDREGLKRYWQGSFPPIRAYQFYVDLEFPAETALRWNLALALDQEAVSSIALTEQHLGEAFARNRLAKAAVMAGNIDLAAAQFTQANRLFGALPETEETRTYQADGEIELAKLEAGRGDISGSWQHLRKAEAQLPHIAHYFYAFKFYRTLGELQHLSGNDAQANQALFSAVAVAEWGLASLRDEHQRAIWARDTDQVYRMLAQNKWQAHDTENSFLIWEWYRGAPVMAYRKGFRLQKPASVRRQWNTGNSDAFKAALPLPPIKALKEDGALAHETVLSYLQLPQGVIAWAFNEQGITTTWISVTPRTLEELGRRFREECSNPGSDIVALKKDGYRLYQLLIAPLANRLSPERVLVVEPDRTIAQIPIAALVDGTGKYLSESYAIVVSPGLFYRPHLRRSEKFSPHQLALVVGSPALTGVLADTLEPLDDATQEAHDVGSHFKAAVLLTGRQARRSIVQRELSRAAIFHFAGHAVDTAATTGLLLAQDPGQRRRQTAILDGTSFTSTHLQRTQLAVLSSCSTAKEGEDDPGSPENLVRILLRAGVPHVVASHWNVDSRTTREFMRSFYSTLFTSNSVAKALRIASAQLRQHPDTSHPYYWASFAAFGR